MKITLASSSTYRQSILKKLQVPFTFVAPDINESAIAGELIPAQVARLAYLKAQTVAEQSQYQHNYIIGSDQLASHDGQVLSKPGNFARAKQQLTLVSGNTVRFYTGLCLIHAASKQIEQTVEIYDVTFKTLTESQISTYLHIEQPYDCAGSFKSEGLGIALFESVQGRDPNSLIGLPLIGLLELFSNMSIDLFEHMQSSS
jgi:septum formation protein